MSGARGWGLALLVAVAVVALRVAPVLGPGRPPIADPDALYHLRVAGLIATDFPRIPSFDPYVNFPRGAEIPFAFLLDLSAAGAARLLPGDPGKNLPGLAFFLPPVLAGLAVFPLFLLSRWLGLGPAPAALAALLASLVPQQARYTLPGQFDHHASDLLLLLLFLCAALWVFRTREGRAAGPPAALALAAGALPLDWTGGVLYPGLLLAAAGTAALAAPSRRDPAFPRFLSRAGAALVAGGILAGAGTLAAYGPSRLASADPNLPTAFQPLLLAGGGAALAALARAARLGRGALHDLRFWAWAGAVAVTGAAASSGVAGGVAFYLGKGSLSLHPVAEFFPPFGDPAAGWGTPSFSLKAGVGILSWGVFLVPPFLFFASRRSEKGFPLHLLVWVSSVFLLLALAQARYGVVFSIPCGIAGAWFLSEGARLVLRPGAVVPRLAAALGAAGVLAAFLPGAALLAAFHRDPGRYSFAPGELSTLRWLAERTPEPSDPLRPGDPPAWGVLGSWDRGHEVVSVGRRPAAAGNFLDAVPGGLFRAATSALAEEDPEVLAAFMQDNRLRYLFTGDPVMPVEEGLWLRGEGGKREFSRFPVLISLWRGLGASYVHGGRRVGGCRHFRLVHEDRFRDRPLRGGLPVAGPVYRDEPGFALFEAVRGCVLRGKARPGAAVTATLRLGVGGTTLEYRDDAVAGPDGRFSLTVPYPSESPSGDTVPRGPWAVEVEGEGRTRAARVTEEDVALGREVEVR